MYLFTYLFITLFTVNYNIVIKANSHRAFNKMYNGQIKKKKFGKL